MTVKCVVLHNYLVRLHTFNSIIQPHLAVINPKEVSFSVYVVIFLTVQVIVPCLQFLSIWMHIARKVNFLYKIFEIPIKNQADTSLVCVHFL
jgi:hypothetical protein